MSTKMIVMDLDGTLLRDDKTMSEYTKRVLYDCRKAGIKVVYATGRGGIATERVPSKMFDGRITMNGAITYADDELIRSCLIDIDLARDFLLACDRRGLKAVAETSGMHYSNFDVNAQWSFISNYEITDFKRHNVDAEKLYVVLNNESDIEFIKKHIPQGVYLTVSRDGIAFIMDDMATKSNAMTALVKHWGIQHWSKRPIETIAFGDDLNDVDMLIMSNVGVAMGNALDEVKTVANEVCGCNNDDGVARWLEENVL